MFELSGAAKPELTIAEQVIGEKVLTDITVGNIFRHFDDDWDDWEQRRLKSMQPVV